MRLLLDEDVPGPLLPLLRHLLPEHEIESVASLHWNSKKDVPLYSDAAKARFDAILTNDLGQFNDPAECDAIRKSKLHHITYELDDGLYGLARASASICAAVRGVVSDLIAAPSQRIVRIKSVSKSGKRHTTTNPATDPPSPYWK